MCLILFAWRAHPDFPLVVAANRDEFFARPTAAAAYWGDPPILAGRDLQAGGTWMGITATGRFAALTNYRDPGRLRPAAVSRGHLVADFLLGGDTPEHYLRRIAPHTDAYNDFNLLAAAGEDLYCLESASGHLQRLTPGIYGLSNHLLDTPWPKVADGKSALGGALAALPDDRRLFDMLRDRQIYPDRDLPRTGVSLEWERLLSAAFVTAEGYGTRSSTVVIRTADNTVFDEYTWLAGGRAAGRVRYRFRNVTGTP